MLVGRVDEITQLKACYSAVKSHFVGVYGRRRVGKTYLIKSHFDNQFTFYCTGLLKGNTSQQINNFVLAMQTQLNADEQLECSNWYEVFTQLIALLQKNKSKKKVIFIDELPWMDTKGSDLLLGLEYFWNSWASTRTDILLIVCGSSSSWMVGKLFNDTGGLYNRITVKMKINPFTLSECHEFFKSKNMQYSQEQCVESYMIFGGIPYYLEQFQMGKSPAQNIDNLCFGEQATLINEFNLLFKSLFNSYQSYIEVVIAIAKKNKGMTRDEISKASGIANGGNLSAILNNLEQSNFIRKYNYFNNKSKHALFQLIDPFCLFSTNMASFLKNENYWIENYNSPKFHNWSGYAFEIVCLNHIANIKKSLGISGVSSSISTWYTKEAQVDLLIERADKIINLVEIKYSNVPFVITKKYDLELRNKVSTLQRVCSPKNNIWPIIITPYGLADSPYKYFFVKEILLNDLF